MIGYTPSGAFRAILRTSEHEAAHPLVDTEVGRPIAEVGVLQGVRILV